MNIKLIAIDFYFNFFNSTKMSKTRDKPLDSRNPFTLSYFYWCGKYIDKANKNELKLDDMP